MKTSPKSAYMNCKELDVFTCVWIIGSWSTFTRKDYTFRTYLYITPCPVLSSWPKGHSQEELQQVVAYCYRSTKVSLSFQLHSFETCLSVSFNSQRRSLCSLFKIAKAIPRDGWYKQSLSNRLLCVGLLVSSVVGKVLCIGCETSQTEVPARNPCNKFLRWLYLGVSKRTFLEWNNSFP